MPHLAWLAVAACIFLVLFLMYLRLSTCSCILSYTMLKGPVQSAFLSELLGIMCALLQNRDISVASDNAAVCLMNSGFSKWGH